MKRIIAYYSLSGNTEEAVKKIAEKIGCETVKIDTVKPMPKSFFAQILVGGGQVMMNVVPEIRPIEKNMAEYDEIFLATPVWNGKGVPAMNAFLKKYAVNEKVTGLIITSGSGQIDKCLKAYAEKLPNVRYRLSLLDSKQQDASSNQEKIDRFAEEVE